MTVPVSVVRVAVTLDGAPENAPHTPFTSDALVVRSTRATVTPDSGSENLVHATTTGLTRAYAIAPALVPGTPATVIDPLVGADASTRTTVPMDEALPARSRPRRVKRWHPSASPVTEKVPAPGTSTPASKVPHTPALIGAKDRVRVLDAMPMFASV